MKHILKFLIIIIIFSCQTEDNNDFVSNDRRSEVMVENNVFKISYNELKEQPNWIEYTVKDFVKVATFTKSFTVYSIQLGCSFSSLYEILKTLFSTITSDLLSLETKSLLSSV